MNIISYCRSEQNHSGRRRWAYLVAYNTKSNNPVIEHHHPRYTPLDKVWERIHPSSKFVHVYSRPRNNSQYLCTRYKTVFLYSNSFFNVLWVFCKQGVWTRSLPFLMADMYADYIQGCRGVFIYPLTLDSYRVEKLITSDIH